jgi:fructokinase
MGHLNNHKVVCFGEVLWDIFPSGAVPGGAPMNVAYNLHKQYKNPAMITAVGNDEKGKELLDIFSGYGLCTDFIQTDPIHETGKVYAKPNEDHEVVYDIVKPVAWDFIRWNEALSELVSNAEYFVFGTLASRSPESKTTLLKLLESAKTKVLDINLRPPHFDRNIVEELLAKADFLKLNLSELEFITEWHSHFSNTKDRALFFMDRYNIKNVVVTKGGDGAILFYNGNEYSHGGYKVEVADTVGSGDAFLSGLLGKLLDDASPEEALEFAIRMGSFIATKKGACPDYDIEEVQKWGLK